MNTDSRYIRQTALPGFGPESQHILGASSVLVIGLGGLGVPVVAYLTAMGIGTLGLADGDSVQYHNLQRQPLYHENDVGRAKIDCAGEFVARQNKGVKVRFHPTYILEENALEIIQPYDLVIDATDNFGSRYLINDACVILGKPFIYGGLHGFEGQLSVFNHRGGPTYRCLFPDPPSASEIPNCNERGILGVLPGIIGNLQALEAVKVLCGIGTPLSGSLLLFDGLSMEFRKMKFPKRYQDPPKQLQGPYELPCPAPLEVNGEQLIRWLEQGGYVLDVRTPEEFKKGALPNAHNLPLDALESRLGELPEETIYLVCQSGRRSRLALAILTREFPQREFKHLRDGLHGIDAIYKTTNHTAS